MKIFLAPRYLCLKLGTKWHKWWKYKNVSWIMKIIHSGVWGRGGGLCFDVNVIDVTEVNKDTQVYDIFIQLWPNWKEESHRREKTTQSTLPICQEGLLFIYCVWRQSLGWGRPILLQPSYLTSSCVLSVLILLPIQYNRLSNYLYTSIYVCN